MANLSFGVDGPTMNFTVTMQIADSDAPRILQYLQSTNYGKVTENITYQIEDPSWSPDPENPDVTAPMIDMQKWETRDATLEETAKAFASGILHGLLNQTVQYEKDQAARAAAEAIQTIQPIQ